MLNVGFYKRPAGMLISPLLMKNIVCTQRTQATTFSLLTCARWSCSCCETFYRLWLTSDACHDSLCHLPSDAMPSRARTRSHTTYTALSIVVVQWSSGRTPCAWPIPLDDQMLHHGRCHMGIRGHSKENETICTRVRGVMCAHFDVGRV